MVLVPDAMATALQYHQAGKLRQAEHLYRQVLQVEPQHVDALHLLGLIDYQLGRNEFAIDYIRAALRQRPNFAEAHNNLGAALQARGQIEEAAGCYQKAVHFKADYAEAHNNLGNVLRILGRLNEGLASLQRALHLRPNYAGALTNLGLVLQKLGRLDEAVTCQRQALAIKPDSAEILENLGSTLADLSCHAEAIVYYQRALTIRPDAAGVYNNLGNALRALDRHAEAVAYYRKAIAVDPEFAVAHGNLGNVLQTLGQIKEADAALEKALSLAPQRTEFHYSLAESKRFSAHDPRLVLMEALDKQSLSAEQRMFLDFGLGKAYADLGRYEDAFHHLLEGNRLKRQTINYDEAATLALFRRVANVFTAELMQAKLGGGESSTAPVFIVGMPRSGSTLIEQMLASHPKVFSAGEIKAFNTALISVIGPEGRTAPFFPEAVATMNGDQFRRLGAHYVRQVTAMATPKAERITDKMLGNFLFVGLIHLALPKARILHARRNSIDTCFSCFSKWFASEQNYTYDLAELGRYYRAYAALMVHWRAVLPEGVMLEVDYEDLVADFEPQARRIVAHCGLNWDQRCLGFYKTQRPVNNASAMQVRQPLYRSSIGRWQPYKAMLQPLLDALKAS